MHCIEVYPCKAYHSYETHTFNSSKLRTMHFCKVCNRRFSSGGALGGHMRVHGNGETNARSHEEERTYFLRATTNRVLSHKNVEEEDLANILVMLSNGNVDHNTIASVNHNSFNFSSNENGMSNEAVRGLFQCKACKKVFKSHQALGGHRASHKKVKGCFAAKYENTINDDYNENMVEENKERELQNCPLVIDLNPLSEEDFGIPVSPQKRKSKMHECSICKRIFSSGQALGGHKRCHWLESTMPKYYGSEYHQGEPLFKKLMYENSEPLDLNLPTKVHNELPYSANFQEHTGIYLLPRLNGDIGENNWIGPDLSGGDKNEDQCRVKLARLSEMRLDRDCSTWLQVGSTSNVEEEKQLPDLF